MRIGGTPQFSVNPTALNGPAANGPGAAAPPRVGVLELLNKQGQHVEHAQDVTDVLQDNGVAPKNIALYGLSNPTYGTGPVRDRVASGMAGTLNNASQGIEEITSDPGNGIRVLNLSYGINRADTSDRMIDAYLHNAKFRQQAQEEIGINAQSESSQQIQQVIDYVDQTATTDPRVQEAMERYQNTTRQAADKGVAIVVAAGNTEEKLNKARSNGYDIEQGSGFNMLGMSDHVISVGATNDQGTATLKDDKIESFSSAGNGEFGPTVAADSSTVSGHDKGTSYSAPKVSAAVARVMQANPNLTTQQVRSIVQDTAFDNPNIPSNREGAGTVNPEAAIQKARSTPSEAASDAAAPSDSKSESSSPESPSTSSTGKAGSGEPSGTAKADDASGSATALSANDKPKTGDAPAGEAAKDPKPPSEPKATEKPAEKAAEKPPEKAAEKPPEKPAEKPASEPAKEQPSPAAA